MTAAAKQRRRAVANDTLRSSLFLSERGTGADSVIWAITGVHFPVLLPCWLSATAQPPVTERDLSCARANERESERVSEFIMEPLHASIAARSDGN